MAYGYRSFDIDKVYKIVYERHLEDDDDDSYYTYDVAGFDADDFELFQEYYLMEYELENYLGLHLAQKIIKDDEDSGVLDNLVNTTPNNINDVNEVNAIAKKIFTVTEYQPKDRGYLLTDGSFLYFGPNVDHVSISMIDGMTIAQFISLGNIRMGTDGFQLTKTPTLAQKRELYKLIANVDTVYVDISRKDNNHSMYAYPLDHASFTDADPRYVLNVINRFFNEGIKMQNSMMESKKTKMLLEKRNLQSKKLYNCIKQFGKPMWSDVDLHLVTDEDILFVIEKPLTKSLKQEIRDNFGRVDFIRGDGYTIGVKYNKTKEKEYNDKLLSRDKKNSGIDGAKQYRWHNKDAEDMIFKNPYFKDWDKDSQKKAISNVKNGKRYFENKDNSVIQLTESELKNIIKESILEAIDDRKDSYQAKPKKKGRLNDWELFNILTTTVSNMVNDKRIPKADGEMLLYYGLYNNDCFTHLDS